MMWKLIGLQKMLDSLFNDGWLSLGLPGTSGFAHESALDLAQE
jgi:hypothetical protein